MTYATKYHYELHKEAYKIRAINRKQALRDELQKLKESTPCTDCHLFYPAYVMDFDHIADNKLADVTLFMRNGSRKLMFEEIKKCELVCANCHRIRTHTRLVQKKECQSSKLETTVQVG